MPRQPKPCYFLRLGFKTEESTDSLACKRKLLAMINELSVKYEIEPLDEEEELIMLRKLIGWKRQVMYRPCVRKTA